MIQILAKLHGALPLQRAKPVEDRGAPSDRRTKSRSLALYWRATIKTDGWTGPATVIEISAGGMQLRGAMKVTSGADILIELPGIAPIRGEVRWSTDDRVGVQFKRDIDVVETMRAHRQASGTHLGINCTV